MPRGETARTPRSAEQASKQTIDLQLLADQSKQATSTKFRQETVDDRRTISSFLLSKNENYLLVHGLVQIFPLASGSAHVQLKPKAESGQSSRTSSAYGHGKLTEPDNCGTFDLYLASAMCSNE